MRGHGAVVVGDSLPQAVGRSYYLQMDAKLQAQAMALGGDITYLDAGEAARTENFRRLRTRLGFVEEQGDGQKASDAKRRPVTGDG